MKKVTIEKFNEMDRALKAATEQNSIATENLCKAIKASNGTIRKALTK